MRNVSDLRIRAVVFQSGEWWVAQCLEYDLVTLARKLDDLPRELRRILTVQILASLEHGIKPFEGFSKAPARFWRMYEGAKARLVPVESLPQSVELPPGFANLAVEARIAA
ncbi:MAG TPA: hypothetical protein VFE33_29205 [Thermoanaerobaculia bacterium]|nr:hypothetical protein [Thermoanaerobaculia bacterium]